MLEKWLKKHSNPRPVVWDEDGPIYDGDGGLVQEDMEIGELEPVSTPRISVDTTNSLFMWHPSGQLIQCGQRAYVRTNPVLYMFAFYGIIGNRAQHNTLAIQSLTDIEWWNQRWFGQAGLMDMSVHHLWNGVSITLSSLWNVNYRSDLSEDLRGMIEVV